MVLSTIPVVKWAGTWTDSVPIALTLLAEIQQMRDAEYRALIVLPSPSQTNHWLAANGLAIR